MKTTFVINNDSKNTQLLKELGCKKVVSLQPKRVVNFDMRTDYVLPNSTVYIVDGKWSRKKLQKVFPKSSWVRGVKHFE